VKQVLDKDDPTMSYFTTVSSKEGKGDFSIDFQRLIKPFSDIFNSCFEERRLLLLLNKTTQNY